jgi:fructoselysine 6-kinase
VSSTERRFRLAAVGDNCVDVINPGGRRLVGGNALNVAVQFARLGGRSDYFGAVGADEAGALVRHLLLTNSVGIEHLAQRASSTARTGIEIDSGGERRIVSEDFGACAGYAPGEADLPSLLEADHVHIGWFDDGGALRRRLATAKRMVSQDISVNSAPENLCVDGLSIAFASAPGSHAGAARLARSLFSQGARGAVVTRGAEGSSVFLDGVEAEIPVVPIRPVDTTGAGDSYIAAFLHAWLSGASPKQAGHAAAAHAARACLHEGGFPQDGR